MRYRFTALLILTIVSLSSYAQEDSPWWKKLFKKETVEDIESSEPEVVEPSFPAEEVPEMTPEAEDTVSHIDKSARLDQRGDVQLSLPNGFDSLDSLFKKDPPEIMGYRVQIFFGGLEDARQNRSGFIKQKSEYNCYLVQNPPNFAVLIGDFRTHLEAHKALVEIKTVYPSALIVPHEITPNASL